MPTPLPLSLAPPAIPRPWNLEHFRAALEARRGRALLFEPASLPRGCTALRVTTEERQMYGHAGFELLRQRVLLIT